MKVVHLTRLPGPGMFSIEATFASMRAATGNAIDFDVFPCPRTSQGFWPRIVNCLAARRAAGDIVHILGDVHYLALATSPASTLLTICDCGFAFHPNPVKRAILRWLWLRLPARRAARLTAISEKTKAEILKLIDIPPSKITVIPVCIDDAFQPSPRPFRAARPVILQVGTTPNKNIPRLIAALDGLSCELHIVGRPTDEIRAALAAHPIACRFSERLSLDELVAAYAAADIVAFVSTYEGFGMPVIEAQAVGRAVVTGDIDPMRSISGGAAALADPLSVPSIRAQIQRLITDHSWRESLIAAGSANAVQYRAATVAGQYRRLYEELYATRR